MGKDSELSVLILIIYAISSVIVLIYKIVNQDNKSIAFAKTGMLCFDYKNNNIEN